MKLVVCILLAWLMAIAVVFSFEAELAAMPEHAAWFSGAGLGVGVVVVAFILDWLSDGGKR